MAAPGPSRFVQEQAYKQRLVDRWQRRGPHYDSNPNAMQRRLAKQLVQRAKLQLGHQVLDIASGTGMGMLLCRMACCIRVGQAAGKDCHGHSASSTSDARLPIILFALHLRASCCYAGFVALDAAKLVGPTGTVLAQDISSAMLAEVRSSPSAACRQAACVVPCTPHPSGTC